MRWDCYRESLQPIRFPLDEHQSSDDLETGIRKSRPQEAVKHFPDLSAIISLAERYHVRRQWQRYKQIGDKMDPRKFANLTH